MIDLWVRQPQNFITEAMEEGFRNITWHIGMAMAKKRDPISIVRAGTLPYNNDARVMLIDYAGASEYTLFSKYNKPVAVYPTWAFDEDIHGLEELLRNPVGESKKICSDKTVPTELRPVYGQKHRVVIHRFDWNPKNQTAMSEWVYYLRDLQDEFPECEMFLSGIAGYDFLFDWNFKAADFRPTCMASEQIHDEITLPSGRNLRKDEIYDKRYADWFELLNMTQAELLRSYQYGDRKAFVRFCLRSAQWARHNYHMVEPFVLDRRGSKRRQPLSEDLIKTSSSSFVLPATRRRTMRNIGFSVVEGDKFLCDTCILHNSCKLYRANSVCTVKGSDTVALADHFGTRSADRIINGLDALLKLQVERLEDSLEGEIPGEPNKEVTAQINSVFANGTKLAKLIDPTLAGPGTKVQVNVGMGAQVQAVAQADPRQLVSQIVRELEGQGVPRESIDGMMIKAALKAMGVNGADPVQAARTVAATAGKKKSLTQKAAAIGTAEDEYSPEELLHGGTIIDSTAEEV